MSWEKEKKIQRRQNQKKVPFFYFCRKKRKTRTAMHHSSSANRTVNVSMCFECNYNSDNYCFRFANVCRLVIMKYNDYFDLRNHLNLTCRIYTYVLICIAGDLEKLSLLLSRCQANFLVINKEQKFHWKVQNEFYSNKYNFKNKYV